MNPLIPVKLDTLFIAVYACHVPLFSAPSYAAIEWLQLWNANVQLIRLPIRIRVCMTYGQINSYRIRIELQCHLVFIVWVFFYFLQMPGRQPQEGVRESGRIGS